MRKIVSGLGKETDLALSELYSLYGREAIEWFGKLWDGETGGFYYSSSARDYEGFLPDLESTGQALGCLGAVCDVSPWGSLEAAFPEWVREKLGDFAPSLMDGDGYFYHPQWGKDIGTSRRGRDLEWAVGLAKKFGRALPYPTAIERLSGNNKAGLAPHLQSKEAFVAYLDSLNIESHSHNKGHALNSQNAQIRAAGLGEVLFDYCDALQERVQQKLLASGKRKNGLFQPETNYIGISGLFKLGAIYNAARRPFKYAMEMIDSGIDVILSDEVPEIVIYVFNPWSGLTAAVTNMNNVNAEHPGTYDMEAVYAKVRAAAPEMIRKTVEKLRAFKRPDGAFSYCIGYAAPYTQGTHVSLGIDESEVNGTVLAINGVSRSIFACLGVTRPPVFSCEDVERLVEIMSGWEPKEKLKVPERFASDPPTKY